MGRGIDEFVEKSRGKVGVPRGESEGLEGGNRGREGGNRRSGRQIVEPGPNRRFRENGPETLLSLVPWEPGKPGTLGMAPEQRCFAEQNRFSR
jgi:hypothetical protein